MQRAFFLCLGALALAVTSTHAATTIFADDFSGGTGNLNGTTPDTGSVNWVATATNFLANGTIATGSGAGTATLAFTPTNGLVYTLDASFTGITGDGSWIPFGFANGQGTSNSTNNTSPAGSENRFLEGQTIGVAWMFARASNSSNPNVASLSNATLTGADPGLGGGTANWAGGPTNGGSIDMRIVLDTTAGSGPWTATWYAKRPTDSGYTTVRATADLLSKDITSVGFGKSATGVSGTIESFSLTSVVPEPSAALLGSLGVLSLLRRRRSVA